LSAQANDGDANFEDFSEIGLVFYDRVSDCRIPKGKLGYDILDAGLMASGYKKVDDSEVGGSEVEEVILN
jgi:hypothetical protein